MASYKDNINRIDIVADGLRELVDVSIFLVERSFIQTKSRYSTLSYDFVT